YKTVGYIQEQILFYNKAYPDVIARELLSPYVRNNITEIVSTDTILRLVAGEDNNKIKILNASLLLWKRIRNELSTSQQNKIWNTYLNALLLKNALNHNFIWKAKDISQML